MKKIGRRGKQQLVSSVDMTREAADDPLVMAMARRNAERGLEEARASDRWLAWRPLGPVTAQIAGPTFRWFDVFLADGVGIRLKQRWETRFIGRSTRGRGHGRG